MSEPMDGTPKPDGEAPTSTAPPPPPSPGLPGPPGRERRQRHVGWRSRDVLRVVLIVTAVYVVLQTLWFANDLVLVAFIGVLFGLAISAGVDRLERLRVPRGAGAAFIVLSFIAAMYGIGALLAPTISTQGRELKARLPEAVERVEGWLREHGRLSSTMLGAPEPTAPASAAPAESAAAAGGAQAPTARDTVPKAPESPLRSGVQRQLQNATRYLFPFLTSTFAVLAGLLVILFVAIYVAADPDLYHGGIMHLFPHRTRPLAGRVLSEMATVLRKWLLTQLIAMAAIGSVTTVVLLVLHVRAAFALGLIAGFLEFIPTIGPVLSAVPAVAMGFLDSPEKALYVVIAYVAIQQLEGHILIPLLMKGGMDLPPVMTILAQALMALIFGFLGLMVAVPVLAATLVPIKMLYVERVVGDDVKLMTDDEDDEDD